MSETPRTDAVPSEESRIKRLREWAHRALLRQPGASIIERTIAEDVQHLEAKYQRDLAAERERADRNQEDAERWRAAELLFEAGYEMEDGSPAIALFLPEHWDPNEAIDAARRK